MNKANTPHTLEETTKKILQSSIQQDAFYIATQHPDAIKEVKDTTPSDHPTYILDLAQLRLKDAIEYIRNENSKKYPVSVIRTESPTGRVLCIYDKELQTYVCEYINSDKTTHEYVRSHPLSDNSLKEKDYRSMLLYHGLHSYLTEISMPQDIVQQETFNKILNIVNAKKSVMIFNS